METKHRIKEQFGTFVIQKQVEVKTPKKLSEFKQILQFLGLIKTEYVISTDWRDCNVYGVCNGYFDFVRAMHFKSLESAKKHLATFEPKFHEI